eukprot:gene2751-5419_t
MSKPDESVKVVVRIRPMNGQETRDGNLVAAEAFSDRGLIVVRNPRADESEPPKNFSFDAVFGTNAEQKNIYDICAASVVESVLNGYNGTIFAYGQTGAGKTHTMEGRPDPPNLRGIIPNSFQHIFEYIANNLETGTYVKDLTTLVVKNAVEIDHVMQSGKKNRSVGATLMNQTSSRSHSIFTIVVECAESDSRGDHIRVGKLNLVDLAGSERQGKTGATGDRLKEATKINLSLAALGNVISALVDGRSSHIPYRDSKLTRLLQNSLGGNAKTVMCANCGPADYNYDETLSTLRYANRAKNIKNKPKINEDPKDAMLREYQEEIKKLKEHHPCFQDNVAAAVEDTCIAIDAEFVIRCKEQNLNCGSTVISAIVSHLGHLLLDLSSAHKPDRADESLRIEAANGWLIEERELNVGKILNIDVNDPEVREIIHQKTGVEYTVIHRVCGELSVSRSIGDAMFKGIVPHAFVDDPSDPVISTPEIQSVKLQAGDEFLVLASDGLWDVISSDIVIRKVRRELRENSHITLEECSENLCRLARKLGSHDDVTVVIIQFSFI